MTVATQLSRRFYEQFGDELKTELVEWLNAMDIHAQAAAREWMEPALARISTELRTEMRVGFAEMDARIERRFADQDVKLERRFAEQDVKFEQRVAQLEIRLTTSISNLDTKLTTSIAELDTKLTTRISQVETRLIWQILTILVAMSGVAIGVAGLFFGQRA